MKGVEVGFNWSFDGCSLTAEEVSFIQIMCGKRPERGKSQWNNKNTTKLDNCDGDYRKNFTKRL